MGTLTLITMHKEVGVLISKKRMKEELDQRLKEANELHAKKWLPFKPRWSRLGWNPLARTPMAQNQQNLAHNQQFMSIIHNLQERPQVLYAAPEAGMPMLTNLMPPPSSRHDVYIQEHVYPTPVLVVPASLQVTETLEPSSRHASADT